MSSSSSSGSSSSEASSFGDSDSFYSLDSRYPTLRRSLTTKLTSTPSPTTHSEANFTFTTHSSDLSSSLEDTDIPLAIIKAYEPIVASPKKGNGLLNNKSSSLSPLMMAGERRRRGGGKGSSSALSDEFQGDDFSQVRAKSSMGEYRLKSSYRHHRNLDSDEEREEEEAEDDGFLHIERIAENNKGVKSSMGRNNKGILASRVGEGGGSGSGAKSMLEQRSSWTDDERKRGESDRPRSVDISQLPSLRKRIFGGLFSRGKKSPEEGDSSSMNSSSFSKQRSTPQLFRRDQEDGNKVQEDGKNNEELVVLNVYLYQPRSQLLNEMFLFWNRKLLVSLSYENILHT
jgi:hypothetical protein